MHRLMLMLTGVLGLGALALPANAQSLQEALVSAYLSNPQLESQRAAVRALDEEVPQALADYRPDVTGSGDFTVSRSETEFGESDTETTSLALSLNQQLYQGGRRGAAVARAESLVRQARSQLTGIEQDVLFAGVEAYMNVLTDRAVLDLAEQNVTRLRRQLQATRDRFEVGEVTRTDVAQAEAALSGAIADQVTASGNLRASEALYREVFGSAPGSLVTPDAPAELPLQEDIAQDLALANNPTLRVAESAIDIAQADVRIALAGLKPQLSLNGRLGYDVEPSTTIDSQRSASIGAAVTMPLYQGGGAYALVRQTKQTVAQERSDFDFALRDVRAEVTNAFEARASAQATIEFLGDQVRANRIALDGIRQEANVGARTVLDVLDTEQNLFDSEVDLVRAERDFIVASYRLLAAVGQLTAGELALPVDVYQPQRHYDRVRDKLFGLSDTDG